MDYIFTWGNMDYIFTWAKKPCKKKVRTPADIENEYMQAYPQLKSTTWTEFMDGVVGLPRPQSVTAWELWSYMAYAVCDAGYNPNFYQKIPKQRKRRILRGTKGNLEKNTFCRSC